jgi:peptidoglycan/LPS O-acetylase OafA/YrhL
MTSRSVPRKATTRLDLAARVASQTKFNKPQQRQVETPTSTRKSRLQLTWLSDMLTPDRNSFGVMRLVLALAVLVSHSVFLTSGQGQLEPLYRWTNYTLGQHGVQLFFLLSGILVAQSLFKSGNVRDYATARALRIFPALIACVILTALAIGPWLTTLPSILYLKDQGVAAYIAKTVSLWSGSAVLPGLFQDNPVPRVVNSSVWTLKYEVLCYILLAGAGAFIVKMKRWREAAIAVAALWAAVVFYKPVGLTLHGGDKSSVDVLRYFMTFFGAGVLAYALRRFIPIHAALLIPAGAAFWFALGTRFQEPAAALGLGYGVLWLSSFTFGKLRDYTNANDYSYATYLYHMPVAQAILHFAPGMHVVPLILMTSGIVLSLAFLSWELLERPALQLRHKVWAPNDAAEAAFATPTVSVKTARPQPRTTPADAPRMPAVPVKQAPTPEPSEATQIEPGVAHVWRPIPAGQKFKIVPDDYVDPDTAKVEAEAAPAPSPPVTQTRPAAPIARAEVMAERQSRIPAGRMALATKRPAAADAEPSPPKTEPLARDPSSAVVIVPDADSAQLASRGSRPRPSWSRPLEPGQPTHM